MGSAAVRSSARWCGLRLASRLEGEWAGLAGSPLMRRAVAGWSAQAPALFGAVVDGEQLRAVVHDRSDPARADAVLGVLVREAAVDGGDDPLAARVVLQLLLPGLVCLQRRLAWMVVDGLVEDVEELDAATSAALAGLIRRYPWRRRPTKVAANLLLDTQMTVRGSYRHAPTVPEGLQPALCVVDEGQDPAAAAAGELLEVFVWAVRERVVSAADVLLITRTQVEGEPLTAVASELGVRVKSLARRRQRALACLAAAAPRYAAAAA